MQNTSNLEFWAARLRYQAELSTIYHERRNRFFAKLYNFSQGIVFLFGSTAFVSLFFAVGPVVTGTVAPLRAFAGFYGLAGAFVTIVMLLAHVMRWAEKERLHWKLAQDLSRILSILNKGNLTEKMCEEIQRELDTLTDMEPYSYKPYVECLAHNQIMDRYRFSVDKKVTLKWWQHWFANFTSLGVAGVRPDSRMEDDYRDYVERMGVHGDWSSNET